jgi:hypothetical protein
MPRYRVLQDGWTDASGKHKLDSTVELSRDTPAEAVEVDRLIDYGIIEPATMTAEEPEPEQDESTTPARRRAVKK